MALHGKTPLIIVPTMDENMWENPFVQENIKKLEKKRNCYIIKPAKGLLASGKMGKGRMVGVEKIFKIAKEILSR